MARCSRVGERLSGGKRSLPPRVLAHKYWYSGQNSFKVFQRGADRDFVFFKNKFADGSLVWSAALFNHRERLTNSPGSFKVTKEQNGICQVAHVHTGLHVADETVLRQS